MLRLTPLLLLLIAAPALQQCSSGGDDDGAIHLDGQPAELAITPVGSHTFRITLSPADDSLGTIPVSDGRVLATNDFEEFGEPILRVTELGGSRTVSHGNYRIRVSTDPLSIRISTEDGERIQNLVFDREPGSVDFHIGDGPVYGLGNGGQYFDRRGSTFRMQRGHRQGEYLVHGARTPIPFLIGTEGWSLFFHRPYNGGFDLRGNEGRFTPTDRGGYFPQRGELVPSEGNESVKEAPLPLDFFVTHVDEPSRALSEYAIYTGQPAMPPKWAMGYIQSSRNLSEMSPQEIMDVPRTFREKEIPVDVFVFLGTGFTAGGWNTGHGEFVWNPENFADAQQMLDELNDMNFNVALHLTQPPSRLHGTLPAAPGETVDEYHVESFWNEHREIFDMGLAGWWPDMGDPLDNDSRLARHYLYHAGPLNARPDERPWSLHRTGFAGMHRYSGWVWSGDVNSAWKTLAAHVPVGINASLSTGPFWGADIGGFYPTEEYTGELHARWFQFGAFTPIFRSHGVVWRLRLPWGWNPGEMGPIHRETYLEIGSLASDTVAVPYQELPTHDERIEPIIKEYSELRYRLMPYTYSAVREAHESAMPIMRALWLHYPEDEVAITRTHEYLWGRDMLIAPIVEPEVFGPVHGHATRELWLPEGSDWYDFWRPNQPIPGGQMIHRTVPLDEMPIYIRSGAILPMDPVRQYVYEEVDGPTELRIYPGEDGRFSLYDDDGRSMAFQEGDYSRTLFTWDDSERTLTIEAEEGEPVPRSYRAVLVDERTAQTADYSGDTVQITFD
ncbi:MAG: TIM-barrel domain-containing protein [Balneolaceae bacterium]